MGGSPDCSLAGDLHPDGSVVCGAECADGRRRGAPVGAAAAGWPSSARGHRGWRSTALPPLSEHLDKRMSGGGTLRVGVIGVGAMGVHHARVYSEMKEVSLVGVADADPLRAAEVASLLGTRAFDGHRALLDARLDAVTIAVPTTHHHAVALDAIAAGIGLLIEKPIAATVTEADEIIELAERGGVVLSVGHIERYNPAVTALRETIRNQRLISLGITRVGPVPPRITDVGITVDLGVHDIDLARYVTEAEVDEAVAFRAAPAHGRDDTALLMLRMSTGVLVQIMNNWLTPYKVRRIQAAARELLVDADMITQQVRAYSGYRADGSYTAREVPVRMAEPLRLELRAFLDAVARRVSPAVTGADGRQALDIALRLSGQHGRPLGTEDWSRTGEPQPAG